MPLLSLDPDQACVAKPFDALIEFLGSEKGAVLDIGCGEGEMTDRLSRFGYRAIGLDPLRGSGPGIRRLQASAEAIPLASHVVDIALFHWSLHHVPQESIPQALAEAKRVLSTKGRLLVIEPEPIGSWQVVCRSFHDETEAQAMAARAVDIMVETGGYVRRRRYYLSEDGFDDFDQFVEVMMTHAYNHYTEAQVRQRPVREAFDLSEVGGSYRLFQRIRMDEISMNQSSREPA